MPQKYPVTIVQGGQWGSEAKGSIAAHICRTEGVDIAVRTGAVNAGHSMEYEGKIYKMQQLPVGWVNPKTLMVIGAGAMIAPDILEREVLDIAVATGVTVEEVLDRLVIDQHAAIHLPEHQERSKASGRHHAIGATGKGSSEALTDKIRRRNDPTYKLFADTSYAIPYLRCVANTARFLNERIDLGAKVLLEGTQGTHLDLHIGPYPYTTHKQTIAAQWVVEAGLSPALEYDVVLVLRTYPIRVAGNSGPMPGETSWMNVARDINAQLVAAGHPPRVSESSLREFEQALTRAILDLPHPDGIPPAALDRFAINQHRWLAEQRVIYQSTISELNARALGLVGKETFDDLCNLFELTTVTRKLRRVAEFDWDIAQQAIYLNRPSRVALTFLNYWVPELWGWKPGDPVGYRARMDAMHRVSQVEDRLGVQVTMVNTGPDEAHVFNPLNLAAAPA